MITGALALSALIALSSSRPVPSGMMMSLRTRSMRPSRKRLSPSFIELATLTS